MGTNLHLSVTPDFAGCSGGLSRTRGIFSPMKSLLGSYLVAVVPDLVFPT